MNNGKFVFKSIAIICYETCCWFSSLSCQFVWNYVIIVVAVSQTAGSKAFHQSWRLSLTSARIQISAHKKWCCWLLFIGWFFFKSNKQHYSYTTRKSFYALSSLSTQVSKHWLFAGRFPATNIISRVPQDVSKLKGDSFCCFFFSLSLSFYRHFITRQQH